MSTVDAEMPAMARRDASPAHFLIKIESFSLLDKCEVDKYETREFAAGNYKWKLVIYPNGHGTQKDGEYVSVFLAISSTVSLPENWEVNAVFSFFLFEQISGSYFYTPGKTRRFFAMKTEWGSPKLISKKVLTDPSNGYLIDDTCVFGAEVFVNEYKPITEYLSLKNVISPCKQVIEIPNFSKLYDTIWDSEEFTAGGRKWKIILYRNGYGVGTGRSLSIYLYFLGSGNKKPGERVKADYTIRIKNQMNSDKHRKRTSSRWFEASSPVWGWPKFLSLASLKDPNGGFIMKDCCLLEVEVSVLAIAQLP